LEDHIENGVGFATVLDELVADRPARLADLGPGGGVPALVIADRLPTVSMVLIERAIRRADFLRWAIAQLRWSDRLEVVVGEAEDIARRSSCAGSFDAVTARSFGPPAVTAECAARLLVDGGHVIVSEPPDSEDRWDPIGLRFLGLRHDRTEVVDHTKLAVLVRDPELDLEPSYPRRPGLPRRRLLF